MAKPAQRITSRYAQHAIALLGNLIRQARIERRMTIAELAERAGVSRGLVQRAEAGDPGCSLGAVFEMAAILGILLFQEEPADLARTLAATRDRLTLLPATARPRTLVVDDDF